MFMAKQASGLGCVGERAEPLLGVAGRLLQGLVPIIWSNEKAAVAGPRSDTLEAPAAEKLGN